MNILGVLILFLLIALISSLITDFIRRFTIRKKILDIPNARSSHDVPTPKGGGISIVLILIITIIYLYSFYKMNTDITLSVIVGLCTVSIVALIDDFKNLSILKRALLYIVGAIFSIFLIGGISVFNINNYVISTGIWGYPIAVLFVVWITNLYNFMDGTDGFAAVQTISVSLFIAVLFYLSGNISYSIILFSLLASTIGFLYWNWPPAKIFMGDVGSCTIGFLFGLLSIYTEKKGIVSISVWLILLAPFFGDATYTLLKRMINGENWYKAHNSHAYQKLYQLGLSHSNLAVGLLLINIVIIWPFAYIAHSYKNIEFVMLLLTYSIIGIIWILIKSKYQSQHKSPNEN